MLGAGGPGQSGGQRSDHLATAVDRGPAPSFVGENVRAVIPVDGVVPASFVDGMMAVLAMLFLINR